VSDVFSSPDCGFAAAELFASRGLPVFPTTRSLACVEGVRENRLRGGKDVVPPKELLDEFIAKFGKPPEAWCLLCDGRVVAIDAELDDIAEWLMARFPNARVEKGSKGAHIFFILTDEPVKKRGQAKNKDGKLACEVLVDWACVLSGSKHRTKDLSYSTLREGEIVRVAHAELNETLGAMANKFSLTWSSASETAKPPVQAEILEKLPAELKSEIERGTPEGERNAKRFPLAMKLIAAGLTEKELQQALLAFNKKCSPPEAIGAVIQHARQIYRDAEKGKLQVPELNIGVDIEGDPTEAALLAEIIGIIRFARDKMKSPPRGKIIDLIGHHLHEQGHFKTPDDTQVLYRYEPEAGIYRGDGAMWVSTRVQNIVDSTSAPEMASCHLSNEVVGLIKRLTFVSRETLEPPARYTPLNNGVYDFDESKLIPFTPELFFTSKLAVAYDQNATCPAIEKFFAEVCPTSATTLFELAGAAIRRDNLLQKAWIFDGRGNNDKSTFLNLLTALVGKDNVSAVPLQKLEGNRFAAAELKDKYLNVVADLSDADLKTSGLFKAITGGDMLQAERKGQHPFRFFPFVKLVYSCNALPDATDDSNAYFRRWVLADFNEDFTGRENPTILNSLTTSSELSGLLNKGLAAAAEALRRGKFTGQLDVATTRELYTLKANSAKAFLSRCIESDLDAATPKSLVWTAYLSFCKEHRLVAKTETAFWKIIKADFSDGKRTIGGNGRVNCIVGAKLIDQTVQSVKTNFHPCSSKTDNTEGDRKKDLTCWTPQARLDGGASQ